MGGKSCELGLDVPRASWNGLSTWIGAFVGRRGLELVPVLLEKGVGILVGYSMVFAVGDLVKVVSV